MTTGAPITLVRGDRLFLNEPEQRLGRWIGEQRHRINTERGCTPRVVQQDDRIRSNHRAGAMAEVAVARRLNLYPELQFTEYRGFNLRLASGDLIGVTYSGAFECVVDQRRVHDHRQEHKDTPDLYIALTGELPQFVFAGWATHAELLAAPLDDRGYGPCYVLTTLRSPLDVLTLPRGAGYR
ncbi:MAG TPA: hypothetical protein VIX63_17940 [Vicinamibacterales bacterium]